MTLEQHFLPKNEFTLEDFIKGCAEWTYNSSNSFGYIFKKNEELEEKVSTLEPKVIELEKINQELEAKLEEQNNKIEELEERVEIEQEEVIKALLDKSEEWHDRKIFAITMQKDVLLFNQQQTIEKLRKDLDARDEKIAKLTKPKKFQQLRKLANKTKEKINTKVNVIKESIKEKDQKFQAYILQQFETHVLKQ